MMPAAKHGDPQLGVDIHLCVVPPSPSPVPLPTPHLSIVFDPFDYLPIIGATVTVHGMKRATAGTAGMVVHIPPGFPFAPKLPDKDDELFMGSSTVIADGDPFSHLSLPVLSCQIVGMISPFRLKKKSSGKRIALLPTVFNLAIPSTVFVGGPPTISLMGLATKGAFSALGKFAKSGLFKRIRQKVFKNMKPGFLKCNVLRAEPVNILTGEVAVEQLDFTLPGRIPIEWVRSYTSGNRREGACGYGWESLVDTRLEVDPKDGTVSLRHPTLGPLFFERFPEGTGDEAHELELMDGARLSDHGSEFRVRTKEDRIYYFPKELTTTRADGVTEYAIRRISDLCGNWLDFERHGKIVVAINESAGRRIEIISTSGRITEVALTVPEKDFRHVFMRYEYDDPGDLVAAIDALGNPYRFAYAQHRLIRHTDRRGLSFHYEYRLREPDEWRVVHSWGDGGLYNYHFAYDDVLNERRITDSLGHVSTVKLSEQGLPISEIDALGGVTVYEYDESGRTAAVVDQDGYRTEYVYDARGNLITVLRADGKQILTTYDASDKVTKITDASGAEWDQKWDRRGLLLEQISPLGYVSTYTYDRNGQLQAFVNARGASTTFRFDAFGNTTAVQDPLTNLIRFTYDAQGNLLEKVDQMGRRTGYKYDGKNRLTRVRLPCGATISCGYDPEDDLVRYVDENAAETLLEYAGLGEMVKRVQPDDHAVHYHYDTEERLIAITNQCGETHWFVRDALGRVVEEVNYTGQRRRYRYSPSGHMRESEDPVGCRMVYKTDALGRVVEKSPHVGELLQESETFEYDATGNVIVSENSNARIVRQFDADGRMICEQQGDWFVIRNTHDEVGNRVRRETELKATHGIVRHTASYGYDALNQLIEIAIDDHTPVKIERNSISQIVAERLSPMLKRLRTYTTQGQLSRQHVVAGDRTVFETNYLYDRVGNLTSRSDSTFGVDGFSYDPLGRIVNHLEPTGNITRYTHDAVGNRLQTRPVDGPIESSYRMTPDADEAKARLRCARQGEYAGKVYRFDGGGHLIERLEVGRRLRLRWDANERLTEAWNNDSHAVYGYDAFGRRVFKKAEHKHVRFCWDGDVLAGEAIDAEYVIDARKASQEDAYTTREYVYYSRTFEPVALIECSRRTRSLFYYHNDPNGCPTRLTDADGRVQWAATHNASGSLRQHERAIDNRIRLQGQYEDSETGLVYHRYRYYSPDAGQFISEDPLGLAPSLNSYQLAANVLGWSDPLGLACHRTPPRIETGNLNEGWIHIEARHITGTHPHGPGDLFEKGTTRAQVEEAAEFLVAKGARTSDPSRRIQTFEKRIKVNGRRDRVRVIVDSHDSNRVITIFPVRSE